MPAAVDFELIFEALLAPHLALAPDLTILAANVGMCRLLGRRREELVGQPVLAVFEQRPALAPAVLAEWRTALTQAVQHQHNQTLSLRHSAGHANGRRPSAHWSIELRPILATGGELRYLLCRVLDVTEQVVAEQQSNERFRLLLEVLPQMAWISQPEGGVLYYNQRWYDFTGGTFAELQDWGWEKFIHPDDLSTTLQHWQHALATGTQYEAEQRWRNRQGQYRWFISRAKPMHSADGTILQWVGTNTDIHERRQTMALLQEKDQQLQAIIGNVPAYIITMFGREHLIGFVNDRLQLLLENRAHLGLPVAEALPEIAHNGLTRLLDHVYETGQPYSALETPFPVIGAAGQPVDMRYFDFTYQPFQDEAGQTHGILMFAVDATERVLVRHRADQLDAAVRQREEEFGLLANAMPQLAWMAAPDGHIFWYNQQWYDYTGTTPEQMQGWGWQQVQHPDHVTSVVERWQAALATGQPWKDTFPIRSAEGEYRWFLSRAQAIRDEQGQVVRWFGTNTDVTEAQRVAEQLKEQNRELLRINEDLDNFVYTASHDLKQPINNMAGIFEELTRTAYFRDPDAVKLIAMFERALQQIYDTIHNLSELVKVQKLRHALPAEAIGLEQLTQQVLTSISEQLDSSRAIVTLDFSLVPVVEFVRPNLQSVLYNLLSNALKYAAPRRQPRIAVRSALEAGHPVIIVQDNGLGIDMERYGHQLFTMFRRFHSHVAGSGMGLYLVNRIVQSHGGHVEVQSQVNEGTTFRIHLAPTAQPAAAPPELSYFI
ncbi:PAS domain-containing sensor histidine kinase [Hymenobacter algoricola]|uniref:histidine kinase n=1 Tax=Hymenobacter algoricola TaxID=486267 RepID=A0ABP7M9Z9_9BACT